jgi:D-alanine-D-alanine ligase
MTEQSASDDSDSESSKAIHSDFQKRSESSVVTDVSIAPTSVPLESNSQPTNNNASGVNLSAVGPTNGVKKTTAKATSAKKQTLLKKPKILGPVTNLEQYVPKEWWRFLFNSYYLKTDGDVVNDPQITKTEIDIFSTVLNLSKEDKILDLCCGQGRHVLELARRGFKDVMGIDYSNFLLQTAKKTAQKENLNAKFKQADARTITLPSESFDVVTILGNSFGYFESANDDIRVLKNVFRILKPHGKILIDLTDGEYIRKNYQSRSWEWIDKKYFVARERSLSLDQQRLISREVIVQVDKGVLVDQFYAERLYSQDHIMKILKEAGFMNIQCHGKIVPNSQRNQDLGMMESRLIFTAIADKPIVKPKTLADKPKKKPKVLVLLGDPKKQDTVKPDAKFDEDDFFTINELKKALEKSTKYDVEYLDNHDSYFETLIKKRKEIDFVFNLCDEGFNNNPRYELHVPALLDMLGIPYSGAGPQALAYCYDKSLVRGIAKELDIPVAKGFFLKPNDNTMELNLAFPVIVKPNFGDSSVGITQKSVCYSPEELLNAVLDIRSRFGYCNSILVEEFLIGADLSLGVIGNVGDNMIILPITEEDYSEVPEDLPRICGYEAKWDPNSPYWKIKSVVADLPEETKQIIIDCSLKLFTRLECRDYARFDWRLDKHGQPKLLEVNPNPGWCWDGHLAKMAKYANMDYHQMLEKILDAAESRINHQKMQLSCDHN